MNSWSTTSAVSLREVPSGANITVADGVFADPYLFGITRYGSQTNCGGGHYSYGPTT